MKPITRARALGFAVAVAGILNVVSALTPALASRTRALRTLMTPGAFDLATGVAATFGLILLLLGRGIAQRRRAAWWLTLGALGISTLAHIFKGLDLEEATFNAILAVVLVWQRRLFVVRHGPVKRRAVLRAIPIVVGVDFLYGVGGIMIRQSVITPRPSVWLAIRETGARLVGLTGPLHIGAHLGTWFPQSLTIVGLGSIAGLFLLALAPVAERAAVGHRHERDEIRRLIARTDGDTLDFFALRRDKRYVFSDDHHAAVAYRYVNGVGLASGDPVGDASSFPDAVERFMQRCEANGWRPAVLGARGDRTGVWERAGLKPFYLGDEALIDVAAFSLEGRAMRNVRQSARHTEKAGVTTEFHLEGALDPTLRRALVGIAERHLAGAPERGFSMALGDVLMSEEPECVVVVGRARDGTPIAFQRYVPCRSGRALSLDVMRRDPDAPNGVNERMILDLVAWAKARGVETVSLNFAAFRGLLVEGAPRTPIKAAQAWVVRRLSPYFQIESLHRFNAKFQPRWVPRFAMYRKMGDLGPVGLASLAAEQFLPFDTRTDKAPSSSRDEQPDGPARTP
ncbi:MAG: phosphatidylglycerol lysyltransferase domain-containing protein [Actinomycetota bacterium]